MNKRDWIISIIFAVTLLILIFPWKAEFEERYVKQLYYSMLSLGITLPIIYGVRRLICKFGKQKLANLFTLFSGILIAITIIAANIYLKPTHLNSYMLLYTNPDNTDETIEIVHNHQYIKNWNETKLIKNYPTLGLSFRKTFEQNHLNGNWIVNDGNPFCKLTGLVRFKDGEVIENK